VTYEQIEHSLTNRSSCHLTSFCSSFSIDSPPPPPPIVPFDETKFTTPDEEDRFETLWRKKLFADFAVRELSEGREGEEGGTVEMGAEDADVAEGIVEGKCNSIS